MIDKYNISINHKETKEIEYKLWLDEGFWCKYEYDTEYRIIYIENSGGYSNSYIADDRTN